MRDDLKLLGVAFLFAAVGAAGCGGGGDAGPPVAGGPPVGSPVPPPPPPPPPPPAFQNDKLCGTIVEGPYAGQESCASNGSFRFNATAIRPICLGGTCANPFFYQVRIETRPQYLGPLSLRVVHCNSPASNSNRNAASCREPLRNTADNFGMLGATFDPPNGAVGPMTSITIRLLTSTYMTDSECTVLGQEPKISDATTVEVADESGNRLYLDVNVGGRFCTVAP